MRTGLTRDRSRRARTRRAFVIAGVCSVLLHVLLAAVILFGGLWSAPQYAKKGEPLFVDIAPEKPEEKAPLGNPSRPPAREAPRPPAPRAPDAKVRVAEAPRPSAPAPAPAAPTPPAPTPPPQVAKAAPEPPEPKAPESAPAPTPAPQAAPPPGELPREPAESVKPPSPPAAPGPLTARSSSGIDLPAAMLRRPPSTGGGLQGGRGGVEGEPIPLDTPDPKYQEYFRVLRERIQSKWTYPREAGDRGIGGSLLIEFHIGKDGRLAFLEVRRSSGVEILDEYAVNAIKLAQPFPPVPDDIAKQVLSIGGNFVYHIVDNSLVKQFTR